MKDQNEYLAPLAGENSTPTGWEDVSNAELLSRYDLSLARGFAVVPIAVFREISKRLLPRPASGQSPSVSIRPGEDATEAGKRAYREATGESLESGMKLRLPIEVGLYRTRDGRHAEVTGTGRRSPRADQLRYAHGKVDFDNGHGQHEDWWFPESGLSATYAPERDLVELIARDSTGPQAAQGSEKRLCPLPWWENDAEIDRYGIEAEALARAYQKIDANRFMLLRAVLAIRTIQDRIPFDAADAATECIRIAKEALGKMQVYRSARFAELEEHCTRCSQCRVWWDNLQGIDPTPYVPFSACCETGQLLHGAYAWACAPTDDDR